MKKIFALLLVLCLLLCGCNELIPSRTTATTAPAETTAPATEATVATVPAQTEAPTVAETVPDIAAAPVSYTNPLNGKPMDGPLTSRIYGISINNLEKALPHTNVNKADMFIETFVNGSIIRGLALFTDTTGLTAVGPVRSNRLMFNDFAVHYDAILIHAGASYQVDDDCAARNIPNINIDAWANIQLGGSFRDENRLRAGYDYEHTLYAIGDGVINCANSAGYRTTADQNINYNLQFAEDGTPANGVTAENINVTITMQNNRKDTGMIYDASLGKYVYNQYGKSMVDGITGEPEAFRNVLILTADLFYDGPFQRANMLKGGEGWFACGGKAVQIRWGANDDTSPLWFTTMDGQPLTLGVGNTYITITDVGSNITGIG